MKTNKTILTLEEAFEENMAIRRDLRQSSVIAYRLAFGRVEEALKKKKVTEIKHSDLKKLYSTQRYELGLKPRSIELLDSVLNPIFEAAVRDEIITRNPNQGALHEIAKGDDWRKEHKAALTESEQTMFLKYIHDSDRFRKWETIFIFLFGTGCRIGETIGLRWENIDFEKRQISIDHTVQYLDRAFREGPPKTVSSRRTIPMLDDVYEALRKEQKLAQLMQLESPWGGYPGKQVWFSETGMGTCIIPHRLILQ